MQKYKIGSKLGDGSFGSVLKGINQQTGQLVAIKKMKKQYKDWQECISLNQIKILTRLHHPNIVSLIQIIKKDNQLYFIFQYLQQNVFELLQQKGKIPHQQARNIIYQTLQALAYTHRKGYFHRDLKPQNILELHGTVKLADFGLARQIRAKPPFTEYVSTRWYRAPQVLLRGRHYNSPMDMFAFGVIMAELYTGYPLFPGNNQKDQFIKILKLVGTPSRQQWPQGYKLAANLNMEMPIFQGQNLSKILPDIPTQALNLIQALIVIPPHKRLTAQQALQHPYFKVNSQHKVKQQTIKNVNQSKYSDSWIKNAKYKVGDKFKL